MTTENVSSIYGGRDPRELPYYSVSDVADILSVPRSTLSAWCGRKMYPVVQGDRRQMKPLLVADAKTRRLTFNNLVEAYVLSSLTRTFQIRLADLRRTLRRLGTERPLLEHVFYAEQGNVFIEVVNKVLIDVHRSPGQVALRAIYDSSLQRIEFDASRRPERLYPWRADITEDKVVSIDARRAFGRPTVINRGLKVDVIVGLRRAGEKVETIARDYDMDEKLVNDVLKWGERGAKVAA